MKNDPNKLLKKIVDLLKEQYGETGANTEDTHVIFVTLLSLLSSTIETVQDADLSNKFRVMALKTITGYYDPEIRKHDDDQCKADLHETNIE